MNKQAPGVGRAAARFSSTLRRAFTFIYLNLSALVCHTPHAPNNMVTNCSMLGLKYRASEYTHQICYHLAVS